ncbi:hypothetical protein B0H17DRAFT_432823 [Mycena rosella]|uniref:F-box domain-containing protein n=1 Tax=Mycena rosella TaxID=1033263 RepID=A0AAD7GKP4_MYCRO|nr:hypothetical protein B0H17DRAFT_432823 [Mycena rosella]
MPKDHSRDAVRSLRPRAAIGTAAEAQGVSVWVGGPVPPQSPNYQTNYQTSTTKNPKKTSSNGPGAANELPPEIALKISKHLNIKDLARAAVAWRSFAIASYALPEFIKAECARFSLVANHMRTWRPEELRFIRDRIEQYNFAWTTLQYSGGQFFSIPETNEDTPWAGSFKWRSGSRFMGESNGYLYDVGSWEGPGRAGPEMCARVCLYKTPSFRTGVVDLQRRQFNVTLKSHYVKAVAVDPVAQVVAILEFNNNHSAHPYSRIPYLHVYALSDGQHIATTQFRVGFQTGAEVYHMEVHREMVCVIAHFRDTCSEIHLQSWTGTPRYVPSMRVSIHHRFPVHHGRPFHHDRKGQAGFPRPNPKPRRHSGQCPDEHPAYGQFSRSWWRGLDPQRHLFDTQYLAVRAS